ncbi:DUF6286 domain-containing protein [Streptomyces sp. V3I7]|uniref:DUF6286 domain-containing protein n=1 Tax=Streptomyces sp. V3I7 TaxID=3042278 RepID=UPI00277D1CB0|nr:DUF6286 domain-containing protein [Streptomyces sp. V3I7]MDQ0990147.1 hypothetical protein [Streptomyces sp. V3I7]
MSESQGTERTENSTQRLPVMEKGAGPELDQSSSAAAYGPPHTVDGEGGGNRRFWSARRVPAGIVALLILLGAGVFLYDIAAVRAGRPALAWRRELAGQLAQRPLDDLWVLIGAGVTVALGLWLLLLALTPGVRALLPMRRTHTDVRAGLHRVAAGQVLRDRAMEVAGVRSVRVRMRRRKADVRALAHFRELDEVRADLDVSLAEAVRGLGLVKPPALSVRVARPGRKG